MTGAHDVDRVQFVRTHTRPWRLMLLGYLIACLCVGMFGPIPLFILWSIPAGILYARAWTHVRTGPQRRRFQAGGIIWVVLLALPFALVEWAPDWSLGVYWLGTVAFIAVLSEYVHRYFAAWSSQSTDRRSSFD